MERILRTVDHIANRDQRVVVIPDGYTVIGEEAFRRCFSLRSVVIPESVTEIGKKAFIGCPSLQEVHLRDSVTSIGAGGRFGTADRSRARRSRSRSPISGNRRLSAAHRL